MSPIPSRKNISETRIDTAVNALVEDGATTDPVYGLLGRAEVLLSVAARTLDDKPLLARIKLLLADIKAYDAAKMKRAVSLLRGE